MSADLQASGYKPACRNVSSLFWVYGSAALQHEAAASLSTCKKERDGYDDVDSRQHHAFKPVAPAVVHYQVQDYRGQKERDKL
jgi:hypothetical protein